MYCQDEQGEDEQDKAVNMREASVGESEEVPKEDGGVEKQKRVKRPEIVGLKTDEGDDA